ncbi:hypothetical protein OUZ56_028374 [Daphnia magna]|uniref:Uncharacterized protein n=1 Tax=Daphnia magna TaxID=35525 RepID=A0ABR0B3P8_9CRUS|nr:hypothetical protein OUZ56_028374 [Daphnia magna]
MIRCQAIFRLAAYTLFHHPDLGNTKHRLGPETNLKIERQKSSSPEIAKPAIRNQLEIRKHKELSPDRNTVVTSRRPRNNNKVMNKWVKRAISNPIICIFPVSDNSRNLLPHKIATTERVTWTNKKPINICKISAKFISGKVLEPNVFARTIRHPETIFQR